VVLICALAVLGIATLVRIGAYFAACVLGITRAHPEEEDEHPIRRSRHRLARVVEEQQDYGYALPPPATTRATWELTWAISDYLRHCQASLDKSKSTRGLVVSKNSGKVEGIESSEHLHRVPSRSIKVAPSEDPAGGSSKQRRERGRATGLLRPRDHNVGRSESHGKESEVRGSRRHESRTVSRALVRVGSGLANTDSRQVR